MSVLSLTSTSSLLMRSLVLLSLALVFETFTTTHANAWWNDQWSFRKKIAIDASGAAGPEGKVAGVKIAEAVGTAPILVRLHQGNFNFQETKEGCADFRFVTADDKTPLNYQIEGCDLLLNQALIWVKIRDIAPNTRTEFWMYWGNKGAPAESQQDAKAVFDSDTVLNYHFSERNLPAADSTIWGNNSLNFGQPAEGSIIGRGLHLSGQSLTLPASPSLAWLDAAALTWSAWIKLGTPLPNAVIYSRRNLASALIIGVNNNTPYFQIASGSGSQTAEASAAIDTGKWYHLALVADGTQVTLYLNGSPAASLAGPLPALATSALLGGDNPPATPAAVAEAAPPSAVQGDGPAGQVPPSADGQAATPPAPAPAPEPVAVPAPAAPQSQGFLGDIDELTITKAVRPAGFIKLAAIGQGGPQMSQLIVYSVNQQNDAWFTGYFAVLMKSVTVDGWVVIGLLGFLFLASVWVMIGKSSYLGRISKANERFVERFKLISADLSVIDRGEDFRTLTETNGDVTELDRYMVRHSTLFALFRAGMEEIRNRVDRPGYPRALTGPALAAIRATLDGVLVRQTQRLRARFIVLTIAIAGGPFIGLLGTVIGVMVTFATIALSGEVNINSIAPGIAGALVATVAGLIVAIPALFGYNLLISRANTITSDMQVFVDEFIAKMSEHYSDYHEPAPVQQRFAAE